MRNIFQMLVAAAVAGISGAVPALGQDMKVLTLPYFDDPAFYGGYEERYDDFPQMIVFDWYGGAEEKEKLQAFGGADIAMLCADEVPIWIESGVLHPWDDRQLEAVDRPADYRPIDEALREIGHYFVPLELGVNRLIYNPVEVPISEVTNLDLFHDPRYAGRLLLPGSVTDLAAAAYLSQGATRWHSPDDEVTSAAIEWIQKAKANDVIFYESEDQLYDLVYDEGALAVFTFNAIFYEGYGSDLALAPGVSGISYFACGYGRTNPDPDMSEAVHDFVNLARNEESAALLASWGEMVADKELAAAAFEGRETGMTLNDDDLVFYQTPMPVELHELFGKVINDSEHGS